MLKQTLLWIFVLAVSAHLVKCGPASRQKRSRMCYQSLDCFTNLPPFDNTDGLLPQSPQSINTTFRLFTRQCNVPRIVYGGDSHALEQCHFHPDLPIKFIVHGFLQHGQVSWVRDMAAEFLTNAPMNVFTVDWGGGSGFPFSQASANTRVVGAEIARMINFLQAHAGLTKDNVHLIGHSLGAHTVGYAGKRVPGLGRITGLDPADPDFKDTDIAVHLDKTDAEFVDIIHSDGSEFDYVSGFGWIKEVGHIDFYPNGGLDQPGCPLESVGNIMSMAYSRGITDAEDTLSCSHSRSIYLFTESINSNCPFYSHACKSMSALENNENNCLRCSGGLCPQMGFHADKTHARGKFYMRTRNSAPFCGYSQHVAVEFGTMPPTMGNVRMEIVGQDQTSDAIVIASGSHHFISGDHRDILVTDRERIDNVTEIRLTYRKPQGITWWWSSASTNQNYVVIYKVILTSSEDGRSIHFCGDHRRISNGNTLTLRRSSTDPNECMLLPRPMPERH